MAPPPSIRVAIWTAPETSIPSSPNSAPTRRLNVASRRGQNLARVTAMNLAIELDRKRPPAQAALENAGEILLSAQ